MSRWRVALVWLVLPWSGGALCHAHLVESTPGDGSHLSAAPAALTLRFSEEARLTSLSIGRAGGASQKLKPPAADARRLITVLLPPLEPGEYVVQFRALGSDGHVVPGQIRFTLRR